MKLKIIGSAGQGIKTQSLMLGKILASKGYDVCVSLDYGTNVRSGRISSDVIFSQQRVRNPVIDRPDLAVIMSQAKKEDFPGSRILSNEDIDFESISFEMFSKVQFANMISLGMVMSKLGLSIEDIDIETHIPNKFRQENILAIKEGFRLDDKDKSG